MENISKHVSYDEVVNSPMAISKGIDNTPTKEQLERIKELAINVFEPIREHFGKPIGITSIFRSKELNIELGGAPNSQHMANIGAAMDIDADKYGGITNLELFNYIKDNIEFDQLIAEAVHKGSVQWVHVSYNKGSNRKQVLIMHKESTGKTVYAPYSKEKLDKFINKNK